MTTRRSRRKKTASPRPEVSPEEQKTLENTTVDRQDTLSRKIIANCLEPEETRVAIIEDGRLSELYVERMWERQKAGEIYKARVESVLPGIHASFVSLGDGRNAFLYLNDAGGLDLQPNQEILVQVTKTARKNKGARVTSRMRR